MKRYLVILRSQRRQTCASLMTGVAVLWELCLKNDKAKVAARSVDPLLSILGALDHLEDER